MAVKWTFYDPLVPETYVFEVNPNSGGTPRRKKNFSYQNTAAPDGKTLMFQGRDDPEMLAFSGVLLSETQLDAFNDWFDKQHQIRITDDLNREFWAVITSFEPDRQRARSHPWKHSYKCEATVLDWP